MIVNARPSFARIRGAVDSAATPRHQALPLRLVQSPTQHRPDDPLRVRAVAGLPVRREQPVHIGHRPLAQHCATERRLQVQPHPVRVRVERDVTELRRQVAGHPPLKE